MSFNNLELRKNNILACAYAHRRPWELHERGWLRLLNDDVLMAQFEWQCGPEATFIRTREYKFTVRVDPDTMEYVAEGYYTYMSPRDWRKNSVEHRLQWWQYGVTPHVSETNDPNALFNSWEEYCQNQFASHNWNRDLKYGPGNFYFRNEEDAMMFYLKFGGTFSCFLK